jgi:hypothetical protein
VTAMIASDDLRIKQPTISFIEPSVNGEFEMQTRIAGCAWPGGLKIYVRSSLFKKEIVEVTAHEVRHCWQFQTGKVGVRNLDENDAKLYEFGFMGKLGLPADSELREALAYWRCHQLTNRQMPSNGYETRLGRIIEYRSKTMGR